MHSRFGILENAADHLVRIAQVVRKRIFACADPVNVAWVGGAFQSGIVRTRFTTELEADPGFMLYPLFMSLRLTLSCWRFMGRKIFAIAFAVASYGPQIAEAAPEFVGASMCAICHAAQFRGQSRFAHALAVNRTDAIAANT